MALTISDTVSEPGGSKPNEDRVGTGPHGAWVLDGATDVYSEAFLPAHNDVHYLVDHLDGLLTGVTATSVDSTADALLPELAAAMSREIAAHGFPPERTHPTCSLGLLLDHGASLELARIGDATLITAGKQTVELSTDFYNHREAAAVSAAGSAGLKTPNARQALLERRREYITGVHEEGVFSGDRTAKLRVHNLRRLTTRTSYPCPRPRSSGAQPSQGLSTSTGERADGSRTPQLTSYEGVLKRYGRRRILGWLRPEVPRPLLIRGPAQYSSPCSTPRGTAPTSPFAPTTRPRATPRSKYSAPLLSPWHASSVLASPRLACDRTQPDVTLSKVGS